MKEYAVEITEVAEDAIFDQAHYIAVDKQEPLSATRWLERTLDAVRSIKTIPRRCSLAEENNDVGYEVRQLAVGGPALLFTVDDDQRTVWVFAFRGDGQLPNANSLPRSLGSIRRDKGV